MISSAIGFLLGHLLVLNLPVSAARLGALMPALCLLPLGAFCLTLPRPSVRLPGALVLGIASALLAVDAVLQSSLPTRLEGKDLAVTAEVENMPVVQDGITRFRVVIRAAGEPQLIGSRLALSWHQADEWVRAGQLWRMTIRANRRNGSVNPGLFDYEAWQFAEGLAGRGYVKANPPPLLLETRLAPVSFLREQMKAALAEVLQTASGSGLVYTLVIGDTSALSPEEWQRVNSTGVIHLLVISGLHIGLVAGLVWGLAGLIGCPLRLRCLLTLLAAGGYALLAGWGLPVQRAFIMLSVFVLGQLLGRRIQVADQYFAALLFCLIFDPFAVLRSGFWLSFLAVGLLLAFMQPMADKAPFNPLNWFWLDKVARYLGASVRAQWIIFLGMSPVLLLSFGSLSTTSFVTNLFAIPYVGLVLVPVLLLFALLSLLVPGLAVLLVPVVEWLAYLLWEGLQLAADTGLLWYRMPDTRLLLLPFLGAFLLLSALVAQRGLVPAWPGLLALALLWPTDSGKRALLEIRFLDVGQGLAVLLLTEDSVTVYDTGPGYGSRFNAGSQLVVPSIRQAGYSRVDRLVVSHGDMDHAGGLDAVLALMPSLTSGTLPGPTDDAPLGRGRILTPNSCRGTWQVPGIRFEPIASITGAGDNNASCLLLITVGGGLHETRRDETRMNETRILLTGDIEKDAEAELLKKIHQPVHIISAPHHGSLTSSSPALLNRLLPELVVASTGYNSRFGHPHEEVVARYQARHARFINTADAGAVRIFVGESGYWFSTERDEQPGLWRRTLEKGFGEGKGKGEGRGNRGKGE